MRVSLIKLDRFLVRSNRKRTKWSRRWLVGSSPIWRSIDDTCLNIQIDCLSRVLLFDEAQTLIDDYEKSNPANIVMYSKWEWETSLSLSESIVLDVSSDDVVGCPNLSWCCSYTEVVRTNATVVSWSAIGADFCFDSCVKYVSLSGRWTRSTRHPVWSNQTTGQQSPSWRFMDWSEWTASGKSAIKDNRVIWELF